MLLSAIVRNCQPDAHLHPVQTQSRLLSETCRNGQPDANLHPVQNPNPEHALVNNKQRRLARCWLTSCSKPGACSCQQQAGKACQMLTYNLFKTQSMLLSTTSREGHPDVDLQPVQNPDHALVSNKQEGPARWLTACSKPTACFCQQQAGRVSQILTYKLSKRASSYQQQAEWARCWLTNCPKPRAFSCQKQAERASQMLTYKLSKTQSILLSTTGRKGQSDAYLHTVQKHIAGFCQQQAGKASQMLTYMLFKTQSRLLSTTSRNGQPAADLHSVQNPEHSMLLSTTTRKSQPDVDLHSVQNPEHALVSNKQRAPARCSLTYYLTTRAGSCQW